MSDLTDIQSALSTKLVGSTTNGTETTPVNASDFGELRNSDCVNNIASDIILSLTITAQEVMVGASRNPNRKYIWMQALSKGVKWGFDLNCRFDLFKNQLVCFPIGNVPVYMKMSSGTGSSTIGEGA